MKILKSAISVLLVFSVFLLSACGGSGGSSAPPAQAAPPPPPLSVLVSADRQSGVTTTQFTFAADVSGDNSAQVDWTTSDGQTSQGNSIEFTFANPGIFTVEAEATSSDGRSAIDDIVITVHGTSSIAPPQLDMPDTLSDIDGNGIVNAEDFLLLGQISTALTPPTSFEQILRGDLDLDEQIDERDLALLGQAVLSGQRLPTTIISDNDIITPLSLVTAIAPELANPESGLSATLGGFEVTVHTRTILGFVQLVVPQGASQGQQELVFSDSGLEIVRIPIQVSAQATAPADPLQDLREYTELLRSIKPVVIDAYAAVYGQGELLDIYTAVQDRHIETFEQLIADFEGQESAATAEFVNNFLRANGFQESMAALSELVTAQNQSNQKNVGLASGTVVALANGNICDAIDLICTFKNTKATYEHAINIADNTCLATYIASAVVAYASPRTALRAAPIAAPIIGGCVSLQSVLVVNTALNNIFQKVDFDLSQDLTEIVPGERYNVGTVIDIRNATGICGNKAGEFGQSLLADTIADALEAVIKKKARVKKIVKVLKRLGAKDDSQLIEDLIEEAAGFAIEKVGLVDAVKVRAQKLCDAFGLSNLGGKKAYADPLETISFNSADGTLSPLGDGSAEFTCSPASPGESGRSVTLTSSKQLCNGVQSQSSNVNCGSGSVTVFFGDNGRVNDDIFSVSIGGEQFSSSTPQREVRGTVQLPSQSEVTVTMRGLAAPDGVGTYYIRFIGATVIGGDATSGGDLTPGVIKTFLILVD